MSELAAVADMDVFSFSRAFKRATGQTPGRYVMRRRLTQASRFLTASDLTLAEIAFACGFSSQAHLTSTFSKHMGTTPGRYRREVRN